MKKIKYMNEALKLAVNAFEEDEIPVGAVIVKDDQIIGRGYNKKEQTCNPLKHAELIAIEDACKSVGDWRLNDCEIYVTLEPCQMCMGAIVETRIKKVIYGINKSDQMFNDKKNINIIGGVLEDECLEILQKFFQNKRNK